MMHETAKPLVDPDTGQALVVPRGIFDDAIRDSVERAVAATVPAGKRGAILGVVNREGIKIGVAAKLDKDGNWQLAADTAKAWSGPVTGRVMLFGSF